MFSQCTGEMFSSIECTKKDVLDYYFYYEEILTEKDMLHRSMSNLC